MWARQLAILDDYRKLQHMLRKNNLAAAVVAAAAVVGLLLLAQYDTTVVRLAGVGLDGHSLYSWAAAVRSMCFGVLIYLFALLCFYCVACFSSSFCYGLWVVVVAL